MNKKIKAKDLYRIGVVVKDAEAVVANFEKYFEIDVSKKTVIDTSKSEHEPFLFNGKRENFDMKLVIFPLGGIEIELIEPLDDKGPYAEFLREEGGGLHHFNIEVDSNENFINVMKELNVPILTGGYLPGLGWKYYDSRDPFSMIYEICQEERFPRV
jgi:hypothetical protein